MSTFKKEKKKYKNTSHQSQTEPRQSIFWRFSPPDPFFHLYCDASSLTQLSDSVTGDSAALCCLLLIVWSLTCRGAQHRDKCGGGVCRSEDALCPHDHI